MMTSYNSRGNVLNASAINPSSSSSGNICDFSDSSGGWISVYCSAGSVSTTNGIQVQIFPLGDSGGDYDTVSLPAATIAQTASSVSQQSFPVPSGQYSVTLTNLDSTTGHSVTCSITTNPVTG